MEQKPTQGKNLKLAPRFFENEGNSALIQKPEAVWHFCLAKVVEPIAGGIERHFYGCKYPMKGFPFFEAMWAIDIVKKYTMAFIMTFANKDLLLPILSFGLIGKKKRVKVIEKFLERYCILADYTLSGVYLKPRYYCPVSLEIWRFVAVFLKEMGISADLAEKTGKVFSTLVDYDDAYRYRIQDVMTEMNDDDLYNHPRKSIAKMGEIFGERDKQVGFKFVAFSKMLGMALLIPSVKKAFRKAVYDIDFEKMKFDEADRYFCHLRTGYNFFGMTDEQRIAQWYDIHDGEIPPQVEIIS